MFDMLQHSADKVFISVSHEQHIVTPSLLFSLLVWIITTILIVSQHFSIMW